MPRHEFEDVTASVLLELVRKAQRENDVADWSKYANAAIRNLCATKLRANSRPAQLLGDGAEFLADGAAGPCWTSLPSMPPRFLVRLRRRLTPRQTAVGTEWLVHRNKTRTARALGLTEHSVRRTVNDIMKKVHKLAHELGLL